MILFVTFATFCSMSASASQTHKINTCYYYILQIEQKLTKITKEFIEIESVLSALSLAGRGRRAPLAECLVSTGDLERPHPERTFVYATMPLTTAEDQANLQRNVFNEAVR